MKKDSAELLSKHLSMMAKMSISLDLAAKMGKRFDR